MTKKKYSCKWCGARITFDDEHRSKNGKAVPLNLKNKTPHDCPVSPYNKKKREDEDEIDTDAEQKGDKQEAAITG